MMPFIWRTLFALALAASVSLGGTTMSVAQDESDAKAEAAEAAPSLSPQLTSPTVGTDELTHLLVPLTKDELQELAAQWLLIAKEKTHEIADTQIQVLKAEGDAENTLREKLTELATERKKLFARFSMVIDSLEKKGGDEAAIADFRAYRNAIIVEETRTADAETLMAEALAWTTDEEGGISLAKNVGIIVISLIVLWFVARLIRRGVRKWIGRVPNLSLLLQAFLVGIIYWLVLAVGLMVVLSGLGIDISPVFALIGGASFIMAFALQDTLSNLASGLMIMINRPFDEGDFVDIGGVAGTVKSVSIVATTVTTPDNQIIVVPNKSVWGNVITNVTTSPTRRVDLVFGISYEDSIADALAVMERVVQAHPLVLPNPEPVIKLHELADNSVNFVCRPWSKTSDYWAVYWDLTRQMKEAFDDAGISIPYPQTDVHIKSGPMSVS